MLQNVPEKDLLNLINKASRVCIWADALGVYAEEGTNLAPCLSDLKEATLRVGAIIIKEYRDASNGN
jgi:hypothetical protein